MAGAVTLLDAAGHAVAAVQLAASEGGALKSARSGDGGHAYTPILFLCVALAIGAGAQQLISRCCPSLPYTVVVLVLGFPFGFFSADFGGYFKESFDAWINIDGHLVLYAFLPVLLFGDAFGLNSHLFEKCFGQCVLLAGPGVLIGLGCVGAAAHFGLGSEWSWTRSLMFGSVFAATDPVAVVGILKSLGVSPRLTMIITGESLLNDGVAIVMYQFFSGLAKKESPVLEAYYHDDIASLPPLTDTAGLVAYSAGFFGYVAVLGSIFGLVVGALFVMWISSTQSKVEHSDTLVQITLTVVCAYLCYFVGEAMLGFSGVLATVWAAIAVGIAGFGQFTDKEALNQYWHQMEYIFNTVLFFLSGVIIGSVLYKNAGFAASHLPQLLLMYLAALIVRFLTVGVFMPILSRLGYGFSIRDGVVLAWGGLRGAVGLALAIDIYNSFWAVPCAHPSADDQAECESLRSFALGALFYIGGFAFLTLVINGTTTGFVLRRLGMMDTDEAADALLRGVRNIIAKRCQVSFEEDVPKLFGQSITPELREQVEQRTSIFKSEDLAGAAAALSTADADRSIGILYMRILRNEYVQQVELGLVPGQLSLQLLDSVDQVTEELKSETRDDDWSTDDLTFLLETLEEFQRVAELTSRFAKNISCTRDGHRGASMGKTEEAVLLTAYINAHRRTQEKMTELLAADDPEQTQGLAERATVMIRCRASLAKAVGKLAEKDTALVDWVKLAGCADSIFERQRQTIEEFKKTGTLDDSQAHRLLHDVDHDKEKHEEVMTADLLRILEDAPAEEVEL